MSVTQPLDIPEHHFWARLAVIASALVALITTTCAITAMHTDYRIERAIAAGADPVAAACALRPTTTVCAIAGTRK